MQVIIYFYPKSATIMTTRSFMDNTDNNTTLDAFLQFSLKDWENGVYKTYVQNAILHKIDFSQSSSLSLALTPIDKIYSIKEKFFPQLLNIDKITISLSSFTAAARHTALDISSKIDKLRQILKTTQDNLALLDNSYNSQLQIQNLIENNIHLFTPEIQQYIKNNHIIENFIEKGNKDKIAQIMLLNVEFQDKIHNATKQVIYINKIPLIYQEALKDIKEKKIEHTKLKGRDFIEKIANYLLISPQDKKKLIYDSYGILYYYQQLTNSPDNHSHAIAKFMNLKNNTIQNSPKMKAYRLE